MRGRGGGGVEELVCARIFFSQASGADNFFRAKKLCMSFFSIYHLLVVFSFI